GFFQVSNNGAISYTRAGFFGTDKEGFIVDNFGYNLQGYGVDSHDQILNGHVVNLQIKANTQEPRATSELKQTFNLNSTLNEPTNPFRPSDPASYNSSTATDIYDAQGNAHTMSQYFVKTGPNSWAMNILIDGAHPHAGAANLAAKEAFVGGGDENAIKTAALAGLPVAAGDTLYDAINLIDATVYDSPEKMIAEIARVGTATPVTVNLSFNAAGKLEDGGIDVTA